MATTTTIQAIEFAFTGYPVTDLHRARAFYEGVLGLKTSAVWQDGDKGWIEYDLGGHTLAITNGAEQWKPSNDGPAIAFEVADFNEAVAVLKRHGSPCIVEPTESPVCWLAVFRDPDGNTFAIHKRSAHSHT